MLAAFYDFDGTLVRSNVVTRYAFFARRRPNRIEAAWRYGKTLLGVPVWLGLDAVSRRLFNEVFYRQYRGLDRAWLEEQAEALFEEEIRPKILPGAAALVAGDHAAGFRTVLVSGGLDFVIAPAARHFGFDDVIANKMRFVGGVATGEIVPPLLAEQAKLQAIADHCAAYNVDSANSKAYSDSLSDAPMLEAVGGPIACNPDRGLRRLAEQRGWQILDLTGA